MELPAHSRYVQSVHVSRHAVRIGRQDHSGGEEQRVTYGGTDEAGLYRVHSRGLLPRGGLVELMERVKRAQDTSFTDRVSFGWPVNSTIQVYAVYYIGPS